MAYDYRPSGAKKKAGGNAKPMLIGLMLGLVIGIAIAAAVAIYLARVPSPFTQKTEVTKPAAPIASDPAVKETAKSGDKKPYTFYEILEDNKTPKPDKASAATKPAPDAGVNGDDKTSFYLQAGAYQSEDEADNQKAKIALLGFEARVKSAAVPDKGTVYRVRLGPYKSQDEAGETKKALQENGINATLVKMVKSTSTTGIN